MTLAVETRDLFRVHEGPGGGVAALQGLTLAVPEGEVSVLLGPSGSGKTTLLRILAGLDRPSAGSARVLGTDLATLHGGELAAYRSRTLGYADQHYWRALAGELTARELVGVQLGLAGVPPAERRARADELLERVGLLEKRGAHPRELSGGEQQRVAICAALAHRPRLLLADEPTGELDADSAARVYALLGELVREQGATAVIVSHDPQSAAIADRVVRIRDGRVSDEAAVAEGGEDTIVVGKGGWLRLPEELLRRSGIAERATAELTEQGIVVSAAAGQAEAHEAPAAPAEGEAVRGETVAELRGAERRFGGETALRSVTAFLPAGGLVAVTGPSGSGKTTLLHLLAGLDLPTEGEVIVHGTDLAGLDRAARARFRRDHVGLVGQQPTLTPFLSARENIELGLALRGVPAGEAGERADEALAALGLADRGAQPVLNLSTGERGRVAIARAVAARPSLLLADEPTARLDQANALVVASLLRGLARSLGTAVVCATHDPVVIEQADAEVRLASGYAPFAVAAPS
ncbi:MAG TPA: ATP-binding cassette domain-containing protein [Gaiellaceae bacterium]